MNLLSVLNNPEVIGALVGSILGFIFGVITLWLQRQIRLTTVAAIVAIPVLALLLVLMYARVGADSLLWVAALAILGVLLTRRFLPAMRPAPQGAAAATGTAHAWGEIIALGLVCAALIFLMFRVLLSSGASSPPVSVIDRTGVPESQHGVVAPTELPATPSPNEVPVEPTGTAETTSSTSDLTPIVSTGTTTDTMPTEAIPLNAHLVSVAWEVLNAGNDSAALSRAQDCIDRFGAQAEREQLDLTKQGMPAPPIGKLSPQERDAILTHGVLNDIGACYFIAGSALEHLKRMEEAKAVYRKGASLTYARVWDPAGFFWAPAQAALDRLTVLG